MKSNRKFVDDGAGVSPVIGIIFMVAIVVAIAATVYVYATGMLRPAEPEEPTPEEIPSDAEKQPSKYNIVNATIMGYTDYWLDYSLEENISYMKSGRYDSKIMLTDDYIGRTAKLYFLRDSGYVKNITITGTNENVRGSYEKYINYTENMELECGNLTFNLRILDEYGVHEHTIREKNLIVSNPTGYWTNLSTFKGLYNVSGVYVDIKIPSDLNNKHIRFDYPKEIKLEPHETKAYPITIEVYGSGYNQIFFPKSYDMTLSFYYMVPEPTYHWNMEKRFIGRSTLTINIEEV